MINSYWTTQDHVRSVHTGILATQASHMKELITASDLPLQVPFAANFGCLPRWSSQVQLDLV